MEEFLFIRQEVMPAMLRGVWVSIQLIVPSAFFGLLLGILSGVLRVYGNPLLKGLAGLYVLVFRGFPLLIQLYLWYFGLARFGIYFSPFTAAVIGFSLCSGAYHSEYVRGALNSIKRGQMLGAQSLGFSKMQAIISIILPQAIPVVIPPLTGNLVAMLKDTAVASVVAAPELLKRARELYTSKTNPTPLVAAALIYLAVLIPLVRAVNMLENRLKK